MAHSSTARVRGRDAVAGTALLATLLAGCGGGSSANEDTPLPPVEYIGAATDEALERLLALPTSEVAPGSWRITAPAPGSTLSGEQALTLAVERPASAQSNSREQELRTPLPVVRPSAAWAAVSRFFQPVSLAHAHGLPFNGRAFYFFIEDAAQQTRARIFTERTSLTIGAARSTELRAAPQPLTLSAVTGVFEQNELIAGNGPFLLERVQFRLE